MVKEAFEMVRGIASGECENTSGNNLRLLSREWVEVTDVFLLQFERPLSNTSGANGLTYECIDRGEILFSVVQEL